MSQGFTKDYVVKATGETEIHKELTQSTLSGSNYTFTGIPSGIKVFYLCFKEVDLSGGDHIEIQLGTSGGLVSSGYLGSTTRTGTGASSEKNTAGIEVFVATANENANGVLTFVLMDEATHTWVCSGTLGSSDVTSITMHQGFSVALGGELTQLDIASETSNTFTDGEVNIVYDNPDLAVSGNASTPAGVTDVFVNGVKQAATSGTEIDFTVPSGVKDVKISYQNLSTNGTSPMIIQLGDAGGIETTGYLGSASALSTSGQGSGNKTTGLAFEDTSGGARKRHGVAHLVLHDAATNTWCSTNLYGSSNSAVTYHAGASKSLSGELTTIRLTTTGGTNTFDDGSINIQYDNQELDLGSGVITGGVVQTVHTQDGEVATGSTQMPYDDTIPQNTEGTEFMTASITPTDAANKLRIDVTFNGANSVGGSHRFTTALFQDSTADALAAVTEFKEGVDRNLTQTFTHWMTAGTASSTTFKVRAGINAAGTTTFNGHSSARGLGGVMASSITITEYKV
jgi:hypothetical protein